MPAHHTLLSLSYFVTPKSNYMFSILDYNLNYLNYLLPSCICLSNLDYIYLFSVILWSKHSESSNWKKIASQLGWSTLWTSATFTLWTSYSVFYHNYYCPSKKSFSQQIKYKPITDLQTDQIIYDYIKEGKMRIQYV